MPNKTFNIKIQGIDIIGKTLVTTLIEDKNVFVFDINATTNVDVPKSLIVVLVGITIKSANGVVVGDLSVAHGYGIQDLINEIKYAENGSVMIPTELEEILRNISLSTTRGIMYSEFKATQIHNALLPIITPDLFNRRAEDMVEVDATIK